MFNDTACFKNVNSCWVTNITFYLDTFDDQSYNLY
jgi:hypothetical protein